MENKILITEYYESNLIRQSHAFYYEDEKTGKWSWKCPESFDENQKKEWYRILNLLSNVEGMDLRTIVCGVGLRDHCLGSVDYEYLESAPEESAPEESAPEESAPEESAPEESAPEESAPEESAPEESVE